MKNRINILGFGDLGKQLYYFLSQNKKNNFNFFDDNLFKKKEKNSYAFSEYSNPIFKENKFIVALGYHHLKKKYEIVNQLLLLKRKVFSFVHPTVFINKSSFIAHGAFIYPMCNIDKEVSIANGVLLNNSVCISHSSIIGECSYVSPGVIISGNVVIGSRTFIGSGVVISNNVVIGNDVKIGIGTVVTKNIPDNCSVIGNPCKILKKDLRLI